eukprot:7093228-Pyramimonas_sp.AAC.1
MIAGSGSAPGGSGGDQWGDPPRKRHLDDAKDAGSDAKAYPLLGDASSIKNLFRLPPFPPL